MRLLTIVGTAAMFMVGGGILIHGIQVAHHFIEHLAQSTNVVPTIGGMLETLTSSLLNTLAGIVAGALVFASMTIAERIYDRFKY